MINAYAYFGAACGLNNAPTAADAETDCNGNGNGQVNLNYEEFRFWQHLSLSNTYPGNFTGTFSGDSIGRVNVPVSKLSDSDTYRVIYYDSSAGGGLNFGNFISFGSAVNNTWSNEGTLTIVNPLYNRTVLCYNS